MDLDHKKLYQLIASLNAGVQRSGRILLRIGDAGPGGSVSLFTALMLANVVAYIYQMLMARAMSPTNYGTLVTLTSISYVLDVVVRTVQAGLTKTAATTRDPRIKYSPALFMVAMRVLMPLVGIAFVIQWLASGWIADFIHLETTGPVLLLGLYASFAFLAPVPRGILLGLDRLREASVSIVLEPLVRLLAGLALVGWGFGINGAMIGYATGSLAAFAFGLILLWRLLNRKRNPMQGVAKFEKLDRYSLLVLIINICLMIMASVDQVVVKHFFPPDVTGNYAVTFVLGRVLVMSAISLGIVIFTRSATLQMNDAKNIGVLIKGLLVMGAIAALATAASLAAPTVVVQLIAGSQYRIAQDYIGLVGLEMTLFGLVYIQAYYHISLGRMQVIWPLCLAATLEIGLLALYHTSVQQVLTILILVMAGLLACVSALSWSILHEKDHAVPILHSAPPRPRALAGEDKG